MSIMSIQGDSELGDLVSQTLENAGVLSKIRAELRANVFLVLEEHESYKGRNISYSNKPLKDFLSTSEGIITVSLVREFLHYFGLEFTASVFEPETQSGKEYEYAGRNKLAQDLNLNPDKKCPLIAQVLHGSKVKYSTSESCHKEEQDESVKKDKIKDENQNNSNSFSKLEAETSHEKSCIKSPENSKDLSSLDIKTSCIKSPPSFQNHTKKPESMKFDFNQLSTRPVGNSLSSLGSLPPLGLSSNNLGLTNKTTTTRNNKHVSNDIKALLDFSSDSPDQNYEEDFHPSGSDKTSKGTNRSLSGSEIEEDVSVGVDDHTTTDMSGSNASEKIGEL